MVDSVLGLHFGVTKFWPIHCVRPRLYHVAFNTKFSSHFCVRNCYEFSHLLRYFVSCHMFGIISLCPSCHMSVTAVTHFCSYALVNVIRKHPPGNV